LRLHGRNYQQWFASSKVEDRYKFLCTPQQLESWKERIEEIGEHAEKTFVVTNNHYLGKAAANATELKRMLAGKKVKAPAELVKTYPDLAAFAVAQMVVFCSALSAGRRTLLLVLRPVDLAL
jgi:uncharacterized protein YecE (DUF72 family)